MQARFPEGTFARIEAGLEESEDRTDFVRAPSSGNWSAGSGRPLQKSKR